VPPNLPSWQLQVATHYWLPWCDFSCRQLSQCFGHTTWEQGRDRFHSVAVLIISMLLATGHKGVSFIDCRHQSASFLIYKNITKLFFLCVCCGLHVYFWVFFTQIP
jgi:hypothetical protein